MGLGAIVWGAPSAGLVIDDLDYNGTYWKWTSLIPSSSIKVEGTHSGCWNDTTVHTTARTYDIPHDWSAYTQLVMSIYSKSANGAAFQLVLDSDNPSDPTGWDYYSTAITLDWTGWKKVTLSFGSDIQPSRVPAGWDTINYISFSSNGWSHTPIVDTFVCFDDIYIFAPQLDFPQESLQYTIPREEELEFPLYLQNPQETASSPLTLLLNGTVLPGLSVTFSESGTSTLALSSVASNAIVSKLIKITTSAAASVGTSTIRISTLFNSEENSYVMLQVSVVSSPTSTKAHPFLYFNSGDIPSLISKSHTYTWAASFLSSMYNQAVFALTADISIPSDPLGWWGGYYTCDDGTPLTYRANSPYEHYCKSEDDYYTGQPYDGAWITSKHNNNIWLAECSALAYVFYGNESFAQTAISILEAYSRVYPSAPYHGMRGWEMLNVNSGGRILSQTLDESSWIIDASLTFDCVHDLMSKNQQILVEYNLLRQTITTIKRNDAGMSNWQSWHNAAIGVVGYTVGDSTYVDSAINGPSGFKFQMQYSMYDDGFWYEGSIGYHFYALQAHEALAEAAYEAGTNLYNLQVPTLSGSGTKSIHLMYSAPVLLAYPDLNMPAINDMRSESLVSCESNYELAYSHYPEDDQMGWVINAILAQGGSRVNRNAFLVGSSIQDTQDFSLPSAFLEASGLAVLRTPQSDYLMAKFGPQGGWHGHYDKLSISFYSHESTLIMDYGTVGYQLPQHVEYFKRTLSHTTVQADGYCQPEETGALVHFSKTYQPMQLLSAMSNISADVFASRTMFLLGSPSLNSSKELPLVLDIVSPHSWNTTEEHYYDFFIHSQGTMDYNGPTLSSFGGSLGPDISFSYWSSLSYVTTYSDFSLIWADSAKYSYSFESYNEGWTNIIIDSSMYKDGSHSGRWDQLDLKPSIHVDTVIQDWSNMAYFNFWLHSAVANGAILTLTMTSENSTSEGWDYYYKFVTIDFVGWKLFNYSRSEFGISRKPLGWHYITDITFNAGGWGHTILNSTVLHIDQLQLLDDKLQPLHGYVKGLEVYSPVTTHSKQIFVGSAPSVPTSQLHPAYLVRQQQAVPFVHLIKPHASENDFVLDFQSEYTSELVTVDLQTALFDYAIQCSLDLESSSKEYTCFNGVIHNHTGGEIWSIVVYGCEAFEYDEEVHLTFQSSGSPHPDIITEDIGYTETSVDLTISVDDLRTVKQGSPVSLTVQFVVEDSTYDNFIIQVDGDRASPISSDTSSTTKSVTFALPSGGPYPVHVEVSQEAPSSDVSGANTLLVGSAVATLTMILLAML
ncbi:alginate lyase family protein [Pelomyxa schiedti]|nr:alginate lyase family protein [Pelomyxa schiedti]